MTGLVERLEKATGPDRDLDAALHVALLKPDQRPDDLRYYYLPHVSTDHMEMCAPGTYWLKERSGRSLQTAPAYTASLDAALALVERVLPGWTRSVDATLPSAGIDVDLYPPDKSDPEYIGPAMGTHSSEAIATCIAALKGLAENAK